MSDNGRAGFVSLVGAGPGDPDLITVAGAARLSRADAVLYDRLVDRTLLRDVPAHAELIDVGKTPAAPGMSQDQINRLLVEHARAGKDVVRLKGGDPFVFGRGGEEAQALARAGIAFEVVPGLTSAVAAPAYAGIPVTHRALASSFTVATGHEDESKAASAIDWAHLAQGADTLLFLMGRRNLSDIADRLIAEGRDPATPAAAIHRGATPQQRVVTARLDGLAVEVEREELPPPVVIVVGEVVRLRREIQWFENRPLFGKRVLVTRSRPQAGALVRRLRDEGADALELPTIEIAPAAAEPVRAAIARLVAGQYDWTLFTSPNGVTEFIRHLDAASFDSRAFAGTRIAAIGPETAKALRERGLTADVVPERFVAEALVAALAAEPMAGARVLLARAAEARDVLPRALQARGACVDEVPVYHTRPAAQVDSAILSPLDAGEVDVATFTASSTVRGCVNLLRDRAELLNETLIACIGPVTAQTAKELGLRVGLVSPVHTIPGLVGALRDHYRKVVAHA